MFVLAHFRQFLAGLLIRPVVEVFEEWRQFKGRFQYQIVYIFAFFLLAEDTVDCVADVRLIILQYS